MKDSFIELLAMWIFVADNLHEYDYDSDEVKQNWKNIVKSLDEEPWKDGKHCGDCTKQAHTCFRCLVEDYIDRAKKEIDPLFDCKCSKCSRLEDFYEEEDGDTDK